VRHQAFTTAYILYTHYTMHYYSQSAQRDNAITMHSDNIIHTILLHNYYTKDCTPPPKFIMLHAIFPKWNFHDNVRTDQRGLV